MIWGWIRCKRHSSATSCAGASGGRRGKGELALLEPWRANCAGPAIHPVTAQQLLVSLIVQEPFSSTTIVFPKSYWRRAQGRSGRAPTSLGKQPGEANQQERKGGSLGLLLLNTLPSVLSAYASQADITLKVV